jgi:two-component system sensor histidine kinase DegS
VEDNGCGFDFTELSAGGDQARGFGLKSMRERVEIIGGSFSLTSSTGAGTRVRIILPAGDAP